MNHLRGTYRYDKQVSSYPVPGPVRLVASRFPTGQRARAHMRFSDGPNCRVCSRSPLVPIECSRIVTQARVDPVWAPRPRRGSGSSTAQIPAQIAMTTTRNWAALSTGCGAAGPARREWHRRRAWRTARGGAPSQTQRMLA